MSDAKRLRDGREAWRGALLSVAKARYAEHYVRNRPKPSKKGAAGA